MALRVLRKLNQATLDDLHDPSGDNHVDPATDKKYPRDHLYLDKKKRYFRQGYVDNDLPHAGPITEAIMEGTESFAIWDDEQGLLKKDIKELKVAEKIRASAKMTLSVDFDLPEEEQAVAVSETQNIPATESAGAFAVA